MAVPGGSANAKPPRAYRGRMRPICAIVLALALAGCLEDGQDSGTSDPTPTTPFSTPSASTPTPTAAAGAHAVDFRRLDSGQQSSIQDEKVGSITTEQEWAQFWEKHSTQPRPQVDLSRETIAYVFAGQKGNSCWAERIVEVIDDGAGSTTVRHTLYTPPPDMMCADVITYPYDIVAIDGAGRTVSFSEQSATYPPAG